jgi:predicted nucleotide-binding protein (sugar kinase/HSP70/actin superfamily)
MKNEPMKYEAQINAALDHIFRGMEKPWMDDDDKRQIREETLAQMASQGATKEVMNAQIEEGVKNGYSVERQLAIIREFLC